MKNFKIMGILNCTPDSYFDGGKGNFLTRALQMQEEGADWLDVGGESTAPMNDPLSLQKEMDRIVPVLKSLQNTVHLPISIDTYKPEVAEKALELGAQMVNDVSGCANPQMRELVAQKKCRVCVMHLPCPIEKKHTIPHYPEGIINSLLKWFEQKLNQLIKCGISEEQIILDPGIGFGKTPNDQLTIIRELPRLKKFGLPLLIGLSRKSFMQKILKLSVHEVLPTTLALNTISLLGGVEYIRVHDVKPHREILTILRQMYNQESMDSLSFIK